MSDVCVSPRASSDVCLNTEARTSNRTEQRSAPGARETRDPTPRGDRDSLAELCIEGATHGATAKAMEVATAMAALASPGVC